MSADANEMKHKSGGIIARNLDCMLHRNAAQDVYGTVDFIFIINIVVAKRRPATKQRTNKKTGEQKIQV